MTQPNVIFIFSDQQRYSAAGFNGNKLVKTPHLDALAAEGVVFDEAYSSCPICSPYRGQILTGRYSHTNGCIDNEYALFPDQETLPSVLKAEGYKTGYVGKWHLGYGPYTKEKRYGFDYLAGYNCNHNHYDLSYHENEDGPFKMESWGPTKETDLALNFIAKHREESGETPFCLVLSWGPPHWGFSKDNGYDEYPEQFKLYDPKAVDLPPNVPKEMAELARKEIAHYYGNISGLDHEVGRITAFLKENGLEENTILCYSSDHGDHLSSHGYGKPRDQRLAANKRASKATPHEEANHIPFVLRYPEKVKGGQRSQTMLNSVDVMPTLFGLAGVKLPKGIQGKDLSHAALGEKGEEPDSVYLQILGPGWPNRGEWVGCWRGLRTRRWTYARWIETGDVWLFDRENDPYEMNNLAGDPKHGKTQKEMEERLQRWMKETDDPFDTGERDPETGILSLGQELTSDRHNK